MIFATNNENKLKEARAILSDFEVLSQEDFEIFDEVIEDGESFAENALKKARAISLLTGQMVFAEDSGLCVNALGGAPGIYSARWSGGDADDNNAKLLRELEGATERSAHFNATIALVYPLFMRADDIRPYDAGACASKCGTMWASSPTNECNSFEDGTPGTASPTNAAPGSHFIFEAEWHGEIAHEVRTEKGWGYEPVFIPTGYDETVAELSMDKKNSISHRYMALMKLKEFLKNK